MPTIDTTFAIDTGSIVALIVAIVEILRPFLTKSWDTSDVLHLAAAVCGAALVPLFVAAEPGFSLQYATMLTAAAQGFALGYAATLGVAVVKAIPTLQVPSFGNGGSTPVAPAPQVVYAPPPPAPATVPVPQDQPGSGSVTIPAVASPTAVSVEQPPPTP